MIESLDSLLRELVAIPSVNAQFGGPGEHALGAFVAEQMRRTGAEVWLQAVESGGANVIARVGGGRGRAVLLEAHLDTVAVGDGWTRDPFGGQVADGKLYGRGACDTKGSLAVFLRLLADFARAPQRLAQPLIVVASVDEEVGQSGAFALMREDLNLAAAITGEPTRCRVVHAHKGFVRCTVATKGRAAHSSQPERGENAIFKMTGVLQRLERYATLLVARPPHVHLGRGTVNVGTIHGGVGVNVVPDHCAVQLDRRTIPGEDADRVLSELRTLLEDLPEVAITNVLERPALFTALEAPAARALLAAIRESGGSDTPETAAYLTNAVAYAQAGVPALVFGPGDVAQAHQPDEFVALNQLHEAHAILTRWLQRPIG